MRVHNINSSGDRGWFIGNFPKAIIPSTEVEVCYRIEPIGFNQAHYHTRCTETVLIASGRAIINGLECTSGTIVVLAPGEVNSVEYLEETTVVSIKTPAGGNDKVLV
jgi:hypothetical protein